MKLVIIGATGTGVTDSVLHSFEKSPLHLHNLFTIGRYLLL